MLLKIEDDNIITDNLNSSLDFIPKSDTDEENSTTKTDVANSYELPIGQFQTVNVNASIRNVTVNEDIPSFREWTKKQLEEAEKQPGRYKTIMLDVFLIFTQF